MIKKEFVTIQSEAWFDEKKEHRYVFRRQWSNAQNKDKEESLVLVVTIRPGGNAAHVEDLTMMLVEKNVRQLGFEGIDANTLEVISTVLKDNQLLMGKTTKQYRKKLMKQCASLAGIIREKMC